jgi:WD40 repeat protein
MAKGELTIWNTTDAKQLAVLDTGAVHAHALTFSPDDKLVAAACRGGVILWDWKAGTSRRVLDSDGVLTSAVAFSSDGKLLAAATSDPLAPRDAVVRVWDVAEKRVRSEWRGPGQQVTHLAFSPDGRRLATVGVTSSQQGLLKLWDTTGGREVFSAALPPAMVTAVAFSPDGRRLAAATHAADVTAAQSGRKIPGVIHVWDATPDAVRP